MIGRWGRWRRWRRCRSRRRRRRRKDLAYFDGSGGGDEGMMCEEDVGLGAKGALGGIRGHQRGSKGRTKDAETQKDSL